MCGVRVEDSFHLLYECPQLEDIRSEYTRDFDPFAQHPVSFYNAKPFLRFCELIMKEEYNKLNFPVT